MQIETPESGQQQRNEELEAKLDRVLLGLREVYKKLAVIEQQLKPQEAKRD